MDKQNLIIITPDQMRADYLGCYGNQFIKTPNIDALAKQGTRFDGAYCSAPLCGPSRVSFVTGTYMGEHQHRNYGSTVDYHIPNLFSQLKKCGYKTSLFGKNHCFYYEQLSEAFDEYDEICLRNHEGFDEYEHSYSAFTMPQDHHHNLTKRLTDEAMQFMEKNKDSAFVTWITYHDPHPAFTCPEPYASMYNPEDMQLPESYYFGPREDKPIRNYVWQKHSEMDTCTAHDAKKAMAYYCGQISYVDEQVGRIWDKVTQLGIADNTIICFFADHGEMLGDQGMFHKLPAFYEGMVRIPLIIYHPRLKNRLNIYSGLFEEIDLAPTLLGMMNIAAPVTMKGVDVTRKIEALDDTGRENVISEAGLHAKTCKTPGDKPLLAPFAPTSHGPGIMLRDKAFKLCMYADDHCELYDMKHDPNELVNLYHNEAYNDVKQNMFETLIKRMLDMRVRDESDAWGTELLDIREAPFSLIPYKKQIR